MTQTRIDISTYIYNDCEIKAGHRLGIVMINDSMLAFMAGDMKRGALPKMRELRDLLSSQITSIESTYPAEPLVDPYAPPSEDAIEKRLDMEDAAAKSDNQIAPDDDLDLPF